MRVVLDGQAPSWVQGCTDQVLRARLGPETHRRGAAYADGRAVQSLRLDGQGRRLHATVRGSGGHAYQTVVENDVRGSWSGRCTCPVTLDCKHVAAVLLTTRRWLSSRPAPRSSWEAQLDDLVRPGPVPDVRGATQLGLQLEVVAPAATQDAAPRVRLRPVIPGRSGRWVRTGISWRDIEIGYGRTALRPEQQEVARALLTTVRARRSSYYVTYGEMQVHLDELGRGGWRLLAEATEAGIALVSSRAGQSVRLAAQAAQVGLDLQRAQPEGDAELTAAVRLPGGAALAPAGLVLVGRPAHGLFLDGPDELLLAAFERPLETAPARLLGAGALRIPAADVPRFLVRYYPLLRQRVTVSSPDGSVELPEVAPPRLALHVAFEPGHRTSLRWAVGYAVGGSRVEVSLDAGRTDAPVEVARDEAAEAGLLDGLGVLPELAGVWATGTGRRRPVADALLTGVDTARFVEHGLPALLTHDGLDVQMEGEPASYAQTSQAPLIAVSARDSDGAGTDWFDLLVDVTVGGELVPLGQLIAALAQDEEHLVLDSGTWFRLDRPELHALRRLVEEARSLQDRASTGLRVTPFQAGLWEELVGLGVVEHQSERWSRAVGGLLALEELPQPEPPETLAATLRPYQQDGYRWLSLLWDCRLGGILADDMGLGKTVQTLAMAARAYEQGTLGADAGPLLVVAPTSVVATWAREAARFCPELTVVTVTETERRSGVPLVEQAEKAHLVITSYALFRIEEEAYRDLTWSGLVLDEAQFVKNAQAKTYSCARRLPAPFKLAITGTPLENSLMDLWSMLSITAPGLFPDPQRFTELYRRPIESGSSPEQLATLRRRIRPLMLRRTKEQVATDLPPKVEQVLEVTLDPQHRRVYDQHLQRERQRVLGLLDDPQRNRLAILRSLTVLRQLSLDAEVSGYCYLDGRTRNRPRRIAEFTSGDAPVFLISLKAGGVGLTLTEADYVFVLDPWWNPAAEAQAVDRAHRIGQDRTVMVYRLVATDTIEEKVVALQQRKRDLFARVVDDGALMGTALTADDLRGLFA